MPPYARAGLYRQLATLKDLVREFREDAVKNASLRPVIAANMQQAGLYEDLPYSGSGGEDGVLTVEAAEELPVEGEVRAFEGRPFVLLGVCSRTLRTYITVIVNTVVRISLCFQSVLCKGLLSVWYSCVLPLCPSGRLVQEADAFVEYARELSAYLQTLEQRLFSEGLHTIGHAPTASETEQYLTAYFGDDLPQEVRSFVRSFVRGVEKKRK